MSQSYSFASDVGRPIHREVFEICLTSDLLAALRLSEGEQMRCWPARDFLDLWLVPADRMALDFHASQRDLTRPLLLRQTAEKLEMQGRAVVEEIGGIGKLRRATGTRATSESSAHFPSRAA